MKDLSTFATTEYGELDTLQPNINLISFSAQPKYPPDSLSSALCHLHGDQTKFQSTMSQVGLQFASSNIV